MAIHSLTILGGGNTAFAVAANLSLSGYAVTLCELPAFRHTVEPILKTRQIALGGVARKEVARLEDVTTDFSVALVRNDLVLLIVPAYAHKAFSEACAPHLRAGQIVVVLPGTLGCLEFARIVRELRGPTGVIYAETDTAPYVCRKTGPAEAHIWGMVSGLGVGVYPAIHSERVRSLVAELFPGATAYPHVLACGLAAMNPVVHPAGVLLNAGRIEYSRGDFYFYEEGVTPAVCQLIQAVDRERLAIARALGLELPPVEEAFHRAGFGPKGDLWGTINGSRMLTQLRAPGSLDTRWLSEDVPYGLATWAALGEQLSVSTPIMRSLVRLTSAATGQDFGKTARTPRDLGIAGLSAQRLLSYVGYEGLNSQPVPLTPAERLS